MTKGTSILFSHRNSKLIHSIKGLSLLTWGRKQPNQIVSQLARMNHKRRRTRASLNLTSMVRCLQHGMTWPRPLNLFQKALKQIHEKELAALVVPQFTKTMRQEGTLSHRQEFKSKIIYSQPRSPQFLKLLNILKKESTCRARAKELRGIRTKGIRSTQATSLPPASGLTCIPLVQSLECGARVRIFQWLSWIQLREECFLGEGRGRYLKKKNHWRTVRVVKMWVVMLDSRWPNRFPTMIPWVETSWKMISKDLWTDLKSSLQWDLKTKIGLRAISLKIPGSQLQASLWTARLDSATRAKKSNQFLTSPKQLNSMSWSELRSKCNSSSFNTSKL